MAQDRSDKAKAYIRDWKRRNPEKMAEYRRKEKIRTAFTDKIRLWRPEVCLLRGGGSIFPYTRPCER